MISNIKMSSTLIFCVKRVCQKILNYRCISSATKLATKSSVDSEEVNKFDSTADKWWNGKEYDLLHAYNSVRVPLIRDGILNINKCYKKNASPLKGFTILDVGCGGGVLAEPLARLGANVTGLDPGHQNIQFAMEHASKDPEIKERLNYVCDSVENLAAKGTKYDAVVCSEVIEHIADVPDFVQCCVELTKMEGSLFFTTINQTNLSYILSIVMAEYALGLVPKGTHDWNKFVKPKELMEILESLNCTVISLEGVLYNPLTKKFFWIKNSDNLYALHAVKN